MSHDDERVLTWSEAERMAGMSGADRVRRLSAERPIRALIVSGYADVEAIAPRPSKAR